jgi:hypothetical protein
VALRDELRRRGAVAEVLTGIGGLTDGPADSHHNVEWRGYVLDAIQMSKILTRHGTSVIVPVSTLSREAAAVARIEIDQFTGVYVSSDEGSHRANFGQKSNGLNGQQATAVRPSPSAALACDLTVAYRDDAESTAAAILDALEGVGQHDHVQHTEESEEEIEVTILMPCLNEADAIGECVAEAVRTLQEAGISGEVLVVDNGSTDGSPDIARAAGARVLHENRKGYGSAYLRGLKEGRGKYFVMGDSDGTYDFTQVPEFLDLLRQGHEFVNGSRLKGKMDDGAIPFLHRYVGVPALTWVLNFLSGTKFSDAHCGMRGFSREAVQKMGLRSPGMEFASEMILQASRSNLRTYELPVPYRIRKGDSKLRTFSDGWRHIRFMLLQCPTHLFVAPGTALLAAGLLITLALVGGRLDIAGASFDLHYMVVGSVLAILGYQLAGLGISARVYSLSIGIMRKDKLIDWALGKLSLERGLLIGAGVAGAGVAVLLFVVYQWINMGFGFNDAGMMRPAILGMTLLVLGAQTVFGAFFLSLLSMKVNTDSVSTN